MPHSRINLVDQTSKPTLNTRPSHYDANYSNFQASLYEQIRRDAFGEDIGQNSWLTATELDTFREWLNLSPGKTLLDVACGAGGPALRLAATTGASVIGLDIHEQAVATANALAAERGLAERAEFRVIDAALRLPFPDDSFDAITCIDAINHFPDRSCLITEWRRLLKSTGRLLFTDPVVVTGPLTNAEIAIRSSAGFYLFVPHGYDQDTLKRCGMRVVALENVSQNTAVVAERRNTARAARALALREIEGEEAYERQQEFLAVASCLAKEGRLSRFLFVAEKLS